jgi:protein-ribulosamine 3-kinase
MPGRDFDPDDDRVFVKKGPASALPTFEAEADGLRELSSANVIRVPAVIDCGVVDGESYLAIERLHFDRSTADVECRLGQQLAALHRHTADHFGWFRDNTIGATPQDNTPTDDWLEFFRTRRLEAQLERAAARGFTGELQRLGALLVAELPGFFDDYQPAASLLHGDLWAGNWGNVAGEPVIFDPAVYYGDRESDIAMTMLFGGFGPAFYDAYTASWPMARGEQRRMRLYQLYHVLNHLNLFGRSYLDQALRLLKTLL